LTNSGLVVIWLLWVSESDKVFCDKKSSLINRCTTFPHSWLSLQLLNNRDVFMEVSTRIEATPTDNFIQHGWYHDLRVDPPSS
jgi:hypothetical protein